MMIRRCWAEIDLGQIKKNYSICKDILRPEQEIMAVVKADGYGHGDVPTASALYEAGCRNFAVSNIHEAVRLRDGGIRGQILILGYTPVENAGAIYEKDITQALISEEYAARLASFCDEKGIKVKCHVAVDTGMNRIGVEPERCTGVIKEYRRRLDITGIFTHLCSADNESGHEYTLEQLRLFEAIDADVRYKHALNSAGGLRYSDTDSNIARLGIVLYGLKPDHGNILPEGIEPALSWKSVISLIKDVHPGETISYGRTFTAEREMKVATVPVGYADGYSRDLSNRGYMLLRGRRAPVVGRVCMDQTMIDVTDIPEARTEDTVVLLGKSGGGNEIITADDMAGIRGTIGYEIICGISPRVDRVYINGG